VPKVRISKLFASRLISKRWPGISFALVLARWQHASYTRGGGKNPAGQFRIRTSNPAGIEQAVWSIAWSGGEPKKIDAGHSPPLSNPAASPTLATANSGLRRSTQAQSRSKSSSAAKMASNNGARWKSSLALRVPPAVITASIAVYDVQQKSIKFISPIVDHPLSPQWSPTENASLSFAAPASPRDTPKVIHRTRSPANPWSILVGDNSTAKPKEIWHSGKNFTIRFPTWRHYRRWRHQLGRQRHNRHGHEAGRLANSLRSSANGGAPKLLTPANAKLNSGPLRLTKRTLYNFQPVTTSTGDTCGSVSVPGNLPAQWNAAKELNEPRHVNDGQTFAAYLALPRFIRQQLSSAISPQRQSLLWPQKTWPRFSSDRPRHAPASHLPNSSDNYEPRQLFLQESQSPEKNVPRSSSFTAASMRQILLAGIHVTTTRILFHNRICQSRYVVLAVNYRSGIGFTAAPSRSAKSRRPRRPANIRTSSPLENIFNPAPTSMESTSAFGRKLRRLSHGQWALARQFHLSPRSRHARRHDWPPTTGTAKTFRPN